MIFVKSSLFDLDHFECMVEPNKNEKYTISMNHLWFILSHPSLDGWNPNPLLSKSLWLNLGHSSPPLWFNPNHKFNFCLMIQSEPSIIPFVIKSPPLIQIWWENKSEPHILLWPALNPWIPPLEDPMSFKQPPLPPIGRRDPFTSQERHKTQALSSSRSQTLPGVSWEKFEQRNEIRGEWGRRYEEEKPCGFKISVWNGNFSVSNGNIEGPRLLLSTPSPYLSWLYVRVLSFSSTVSYGDWSLNLQVGWVFLLVSLIKLWSFCCSSHPCPLLAVCELC